jgi:outer membrane lipoprotein-sorting protein
MQRRVLALTGLVLVLSLVLAGCGQQMTPEDIVERVRETAASTQDAHGVITVSADIQGNELSATAEVWEKSPNKVRAEVVESSRPELKGMVLVSDGEQAWLYDPAENKVITGNAGEMDLPLPEQLLSSMQEIVQEVLDASDVRLEGEEQVAGHATYKLSLTPKEGEQAMALPGNGTATLWVDQERWIVLKASYEAGGLGQGTLEVQSYELNTGVPDDLFRFEAPQGVEVVQAEAQKPQSLTLDEARAQASFPLLVPEYVPDGTTLIEVYKLGEAIILRYDHSPEAAFTVVQGDTGTPNLSPETAGLGRPVTVRGQSGTAISDEASGSTLLVWTENGVSVSVAGHISLDEAIKVAESMK